MGKKSKLRKKLLRQAKSILSALLMFACMDTLVWAGPPIPAPPPPSPSPALPAPSKVDHQKQAFAGKLPITELDEQEAILHALNRLGFGPRPGEVEQIEKAGLENWVQGQLHPE